MDTFNDQPEFGYDDTPEAASGNASDEEAAATGEEAPATADAASAGQTEMQNTDGVYHTAQPPYATYEAPTYRPDSESGYTQGDASGFQPFQTAAAEEKPKKQRRKKKSKLPLVAAVLACTLIGSAAGAAVTGAVLNRQWRATADKLQQQVDDLQSGVNGTIIHTASTTVTNTPSADGLMNPAQVYEQNVASVVSVTTTGYTSNGWGTSTFTSVGSGFLITADGYVLTNYHVIEGYSAVTVTTISSTEYEAEVVGYDSLSDVALLKIEGENLPCVTIGDSDVLAVGDMVAAIGNPLGELASTQTVGYLSAKNRMVNTDGTILNMLQTDAAINSGNSGGPLFNMMGQVIGITTAKYSGSSSSGATIEGIGFAIPINTVMDLVDDLMEHGYVTGQAYLGITVQEMDSSVAAAYGLPAGPKVQSVTEGSCAEKAGLKSGDIITGLGDIEISSYSDLSYALRTYRAGDTAELSIYRAGQELTLTVTFDEKPVDTDTTEEVPQESQSSSGGDIFSQFPFNMLP